MGTWSKGSMERELVAAIAVAVQRGDAMALGTCYTRASSAQARTEGRGAAGSGAEVHGGNDMHSALEG